MMGMYVEENIENRQLKQAYKLTQTNIKIHSSVCVYKCIHTHTQITQQTDKSASAWEDERMC